MVPTLTCGLLRSNFSFAIAVVSSSTAPSRSRLGLRADFSLRPAGDFFSDILGHFFVLPEMHGERAAALRPAAQLRGVSEHFRQRNHGLDDLRGPEDLGSFQPPPPRNQIPIHGPHI